MKMHRISNNVDAQAASRRVPPRTPRTPKVQSYSLDKTMKPEYDLASMKSRPNPYAKQLKQQVTLPLEIDVIEFFQKKAEEKGISYQE